MTSFSKGNPFELVSLRQIIKEETEDLPDKERIRNVMEDFPESGPGPAKLVKRVALAYGRRKRIKKGI